MCRVRRSGRNDDCASGRHIGADYFVWASDYPHIYSSFGVAKEIKERIEPLPVDAQRKVLGGNAIRFYNFPVGQ